MNPDVDLMRDLLLVLEDRQVSPRETVVIATETEAEDLGRIPEAVDEALSTLLDLGYIDGPGHDEPGFFFFRKLTRKGAEFLRATRAPGDWARMKRRYQGRFPLTAGDD